ncbi:cyanate hydratase [Russula compacta]|nr:cyanate hydratase [Russula compacta]
MAYNADTSIPRSNALSGRSPPDAFSVLFDAKARHGLTFEQIAQVMNKDEVWVAALFYGQAKASEDELRALASVLKLTRKSEFVVSFEPDTEWLIRELGSRWYPNRGIGPIPPTDPVIYRLFEGVLVYGHAIKAIIHEKFGDGIMSMIDCKIHVDKKEDPKGDRVVLTFDGKFLPYAKW